MTSIARKIPVVTKVDVEKYVNKETGEVMQSEMGMGMGKVHVVGQSESVLISSDEYIIIDSQAIEYVGKEFAPMDVGRIMKMANMTYGPYNIIHKNGAPCTDDQLMQELNYSRNKYADFMKRLYRKSVIYYMSGVFEGKEAKYILLNPHLARKRKTVHVDVLSVFDNISKRGL
jgi:hypothetical protein